MGAAWLAELPTFSSACHSQSGDLQPLRIVIRPQPYIIEQNAVAAQTALGTQSSRQHRIDPACRLCRVRVCTERVQGTKSGREKSFAQRRRKPDHTFSGRRFTFPSIGVSNAGRDTPELAVNGGIVGSAFELERRILVDFLVHVSP